MARLDVPKAFADPREDRTREGERRRRSSNKGRKERNFVILVHSQVYIHQEVDRQIRAREQERRREWYLSKRVFPIQKANTTRDLTALFKEVFSSFREENTIRLHKKQKDSSIQLRLFPSMHAGLAICLRVHLAIPGGPNGALQWMKGKRRGR